MFQFFYDDKKFEKNGKTYNSKSRLTRRKPIMLAKVNLLSGELKSGK